MQIHYAEARQSKVDLHSLEIEHERHQEHGPMEDNSPSDRYRRSRTEKSHPRTKPVILHQLIQCQATIKVLNRNGRFIERI